MKFSPQKIMERFVNLPTAHQVDPDALSDFCLETGIGAFNGRDGERFMALRLAEPVEPQDLLLGQPDNKPLGAASESKDKRPYRILFLNETDKNHYEAQMDWKSLPSIPKYYSSVLSDKNSNNWMKFLYCLYLIGKFRLELSNLLQLWRERHELNMSFINKYFAQLGSKLMFYISGYGFNMSQDIHSGPYDDFHVDIQRVVPTFMTFDEEIVLLCLIEPILNKEPPVKTLLKNRICPVCGKLFFYKLERATFCSPQCRARAFQKAR
jgi:hypothetical protein